MTEVALFAESFVLVRPGKDAGKPVPDRKKLREMRLLLLEEGHCFRDQALSFCNIHAGLPRELLDVSSLSTLVQMVSAGIGVTLIPEMAVAVETRSTPVSISSFENPQPSRTIDMIWRKTSPLAKQLQQICEVVRQSAETMRAERSALPPQIRPYRRRTSDQIHGFKIQKKNEVAEDIQVPYRGSICLPGCICGADTGTDGEEEQRSSFTRFRPMRLAL